MDVSMKAAFPALPLTASSSVRSPLLFFTNNINRKDSPAGTLSYTITSTVEGFAPITGEITVENTWDAAVGGTAKPHDTDYQVGPQWWTDSYVPDDYWHNCAGARYQYIVREDIMRDWAERWLWLKE
ncbi:MAG: hypothetical protein K6A96_04565 [Prevotella sp.]|nr:hypothetical protein [Prevotella sp.]